jgi:cell fate regulator YaaT (PSP1 superfamily)
VSDAVLVRYGVTGQTQLYATGDEKLAPHEHVIVETDLGQRMGTVLDLGASSTEKLPPIVRKATVEDERLAARHAASATEALAFAKSCVEQHGLAMRLMDAEIVHTGTRTLFYFVSEDRVDFRALVRDLARRFHTRIELRQIGVRDAARRTGGIGLCGRELCCSAWLPSFAPVSIRMAKDQNLSPTHDSLAGACGRLRCCLAYEHEAYEEQRKALPKVGKRVTTPDGEGRVKDVNVLAGRVRVQLLDGRYVTHPAASLGRPADVLAQQEHQRQVEEERQAATLLPSPRGTK